MRYVFFLSLADMVAALSFFLSAYCVVQSFMGHIGHLSSILWTLCFAHSILLKIHGRSASPPRTGDRQAINGSGLDDSLLAYYNSSAEARHLQRGEPLCGLRDVTYHVLCWTVPAITAAGLYWEGSFDNDSRWCWVEEQDEFRIYAFYLPMFVLILANLAMFVLIKRRLATLPAGAPMPVRVNKRLSLYIMVCVFVWTPALIDRFVTMMTGDAHFTLRLLNALVTPLQGFANVVVFGFSVPSFRESFGRMQFAVKAPLSPGASPSAGNGLSGLGESPLLNASTSDYGDAASTSSLARTRLGSHEKAPSVLSERELYMTVDRKRPYAGASSGGEHAVGDLIAPTSTIIGCYVIVAFQMGMDPFIVPNRFLQEAPLLMNGISRLIGLFFSLLLLGALGVIDGTASMRSTAFGQLIRSQVRQRMTWKMCFHTAIFAVLFDVIPSTVSNYAMSTLGYGFVWLAFGTAPLLTLVVKRIAVIQSKYGVSFGRNTLLFAGLLSGFVGVVLISLPQILSMPRLNTHIYTIPLLLLAVLCTAAGAVWHDVRLGGWSAVPKLVIYNAVSAIISMLLSWSWEFVLSRHYGFISSVSTSDWILVFVQQGLGRSFFTSFAFLILLPRIHSVRTTSAWLLVAIVGFLYSLLVNGPDIGLGPFHKSAKWFLALQIGGCFIILGGFVLTMIPRLRDLVHAQNLRSLISYETAYDVADSDGGRNEAFSDGEGSSYDDEGDLDDDLSDGNYNPQAY